MKRKKISDTQERILSHLARVAFATSAQLRVWLDVDQSNISRALSDMVEQGLVETTQNRPAVVYLTHAAYSILQQPMPAGERHASWSVMAHACHKNAFEILKNQQGEFRFLSRLSLLRQGLNPAHGEHAALDEEGKTWFVLLDDYMMAPDRIKRSWSRRHTPNKKYWSDPTGRVWRDVAHHYVVVTTSEHQAERYRVYVADQGIPATVELVSAIWEG